MFNSAPKGNEGGLPMGLESADMDAVAAHLSAIGEAGLEVIPERVNVDDPATLSEEVVQAMRNQGYL